MRWKRTSIRCGERGEIVRTACLEEGADRVTTRMSGRGAREVWRVMARSDQLLEVDKGCGGRRGQQWAPGRRVGECDGEGAD
ncbi:hypothetical protein KSP40_PGU011400 [Platanthera guangdongensis]|uniref:Uncharacterized protein n=1 Tax=Platanthera guangdongensis TaxID=2320717 RepID=A0ABR2LYQ4_9ASPA